MSTPIVKICPRCASSLTCHREAVAQCACATVILAPATRAYLAKTAYDCLCPGCLRELNELAQAAARQSFPAPGEPLVEGLHYYREGGKWVFTEYYHILRGTCCRSGCRHCAYGYRAVE